MKLIVSLIFTWMLSCTALECLISVNNETVESTCGLNEFCRTAAVKDRFGGQHQEKSCFPSFSCHPMSGIRSYNLDFDRNTESYVCCNTDRCNSQDLPYPDASKNGLQCYTCHNDTSTVCNEKVDCVGVEDRCIGGTEPNGRKSFGCISRNMCDPSASQDSQNVTIGPKCCESSLCNSVETSPEQPNSASSSLSGFSFLIVLGTLII